MGTGVFTIAGVTFAAESPWEISPSENFVPFAKKLHYFEPALAEPSKRDAERTVRIIIGTVRDECELLYGGEAENGKVTSNERF